MDNIRYSDSHLRGIQDAEIGKRGNRPSVVGGSIFDETFDNTPGLVPTDDYAIVQGLTLWGKGVVSFEPPTDDQDFYAVSTAGILSDHLEIFQHFPPVSNPAFPTETLTWSSGSEVGSIAVNFASKTSDGPPSVTITHSSGLFSQLQFGGDNYQEVAGPSMPSADGRSEVRIDTGGGPSLVVDVVGGAQPDDVLLAGAPIAATANIANLYGPAGDDMLIAADAHLVLAEGPVIKAATPACLRAGISTRTILRRMPLSVELGAPRWRISASRCSQDHRVTMARISFEGAGSLDVCDTDVVI